MSLAVKRICLLASVVLGVLALGAGLASAAGKPTSVAITNTHELNGYTVIELTAKVNPNGASTSTRIEFREAGGGGWFEAPVHILSGTTVRSYSEEFQVKPVQNYEARVKAENLYGTTLSTIATVSTRVRATGEKELTNVPFGSEGVANFVWKYAGYNWSVVCNENSWGSVGNAGGKGDIYHYSMFGCILFRNGKELPECKVSNFTFPLGGPTLYPENGINVIPVLGGCAPGEYWGLAPKPFRVVDNGSAAEYSKERSLTLTADATFGTSNPAEITIESNWYLSGEYTNTPFKIADIGL
jgi:hypothetical protein